jgi:hypothetical protein
MITGLQAYKTTGDALNEECVHDRDRNVAWDIVA